MEIMLEEQELSSWYDSNPLGLALGEQCGLCERRLVQWDLPHRQQLCCGSLTSLSSWGPSPCQEGPSLLFGSLLGLSVHRAFLVSVRLARGFWFSPSASPLYIQPEGTACQKGASCGKQRSGACRGGGLRMFCPLVFPGLVVKGLG